LEIRAEAQERSGDAAGAIRSLREALRFREEVFGQQMSDRVAALQVSFDARQARLMAERAQEENVRLTAAMREVEAASAVRSRFLANMSHELRTPLTGVIGAAELLQARGLAPDTQRLVDIIGSAADALLAMINDVLDFSRIEAGRLELAHEVVDPAELAHEVMALVASGVRSGVDVRVDVEAGVPRGIWSDRNRLRQVLLNLSANAVKFTERGFVELHVSRLDDALVCRVTDTGIGIAPGGRERLFEPFVQADGSDTRRFGGTGLGLAITRRIVDAMGGRIDVSSAEGVGSTFTVVLPLRPARVTQRAPAPATQAVAPYRVLLVEDDEMVRGVLGELLAVCGAHVTAVGSAEEALDAAASDLPALVVMDVQMPRMDGITCARELRARHGATLRILVVSGATAARDEAAARAAGVDGWLSKPVTLRGLRAELERLGVRRVT
jgi:signal transduction histidine kinase